MLQVEKDLVSFKLEKGINRLSWRALSLIEELYDDGSNFSEDELNRLRKTIREEGNDIKDEIANFLKELEKTNISLKNSNLKI